VSATAGRDLIANAVKALLIAFACMLVYIAIRFDFYSGVVALGCLLHDVGIMYAFMIFFRGIYQANSAFIAAILTIIGYSINNTIIIFDRVREVSKKPGFTQASKMDVVEYSVGATLSRTINTSLTTLISLVFLYIFGVSSIREFMFPLIVGMLAGVYSSVMLGCQVWAMWIDKMNANKALKGDTKKANKA
jgi:preprotein translocase subunit SecF